MNEIESVLIDDERSNRELIRSLIPHLNEAYKIVGEAASVEEGFNEINKLQPDVVFLDIKMGDGTGFDLLRKFNRITFEVVFVSGFDEYALRAFEYNALDYVLKPVDLNKFKDTLIRVQERVTNSNKYFENLKKVLHTYDPQDLIITKIPIHHSERVILLDLKEVAYIMSSESCTFFYKSKNEKYSSAKQLADFGFILESFPNFLKINKSSYINVNFIDSYAKGLTSSITMKDGTVHEISRRKKTQILEILAKQKVVIRQQD